MKIRIASKARRAISPIIATVLIIAVTLIASVAIGGFVFGIFAQGQNSAQVSVTSTNLLATSFTAGTIIAPTCSTAAANAYLTLTNIGTGAASVTSVSITTGGNVNSVNLATTCNVAAAGYAGTGGPTTGTPISILFGSAGANRVTGGATAGATYTGTVTLSNGAQLLFTGTFA